MKNEQNTPVYDVIIAGAGPVGLFLACELALAKCSLKRLKSLHQPDFDMNASLKLWRANMATT